MNKNKGFTMIELMVVIAIIGVLAAIVLAALNSSNSKSRDAKVQSQLKSMTSQAQLFIGTTGTAAIVGGHASISVPYSGDIVVKNAGGTAASGTLFNDTTVANSGLYRLGSSLPSGTLMYYGWDGISPLTAGKWFFAVSLGAGSYCVDSSGSNKISTSTVTNTVASFVSVFPNATVAGGYLCN